MRFALKAEFGRVRADSRHPFLQVPLKLSVKNTGSFPVYVIVDDFTVYGRTARYTEQGTSLAETWEQSLTPDKGKEDAETYVDRFEYATLSSGRLHVPGDPIESGQEDTQEHVLQIPRTVGYDLLRVDFQLTFMRKDRGRIDVRQFHTKHLSWNERDSRFFCLVRWCAERILYLGRVRHNNNLVNVTHGPRYVLAGWDPERPPLYSISSYHFETPPLHTPSKEEREVERFGISAVETSTEISLAELTSSLPAHRPS